jgi:hypothetical protein
MNKTVLAMLALAGAVVAAQPSALTPEQTLDRRGIGELDLSPDGARLLFTVTEPVKEPGASATSGCSTSPAGLSGS